MQDSANITALSQAKANMIEITQKKFVTAKQNVVVDLYAVYNGNKNPTITFGAIDSDGKVLNELDKFITVGFSDGGSYKVLNIPLVDFRDKNTGKMLNVKFHLPQIILQAGNFDANENGYKKYMPLDLSTGQNKQQLDIAGINPAFVGDNGLKPEPSVMVSNVSHLLSTKLSAPASKS